MVNSNTANIISYRPYQFVVNIPIDFVVIPFNAIPMVIGAVVARMFAYANLFNAYRTVKIIPYVAFNRTWLISVCLKDIYFIVPAIICSSI